MNNLTAKALAEFAIPSYQSKVEEEWANSGEIYMQEHFGIPVLRQDYEPLTLNLPGGIKYKPDFLYILDNFNIVLAEIKNSRKNKGYRTTLNKLKTAAEIYPYFIYIEVIKDEGWKIRRIGD